MKKIVCILAAYLLIILISCNDRINSRNYERIKLDMSKQEVEHILGKGRSTKKNIIIHDIAINREVETWYGVTHTIHVFYENNRVHHSFMTKNGSGQTVLFSVL